MSLVSFYTSDGRHWLFFHSVMRELINHKIIPLIVSGQIDDGIRMLPCAKLIGISGDVFKIIKPRLHVQMQDHDEYHKKMIDFCYAKNIPTLVIQHGYSRYYPEQIIEGNADYVCVWSAKEAEKVSHHLRDKKTQILVTGNPAYDIFPIVEKTNSIANVLVTTRPTKGTDGPVCDMDDNKSTEYFNKILDCVEENPHITFYIKNHPSPLDDWDFYQNIINSRSNSINNIVHCDREEFVSNLIANRDINCLISYPTTSAQVDVAVMDVPIIDITDDFSLTEEINRINDGQTPRSYQYPEIPRDRLSGARIAHTISNIIRMGKPL